MKAKAVPIIMALVLISGFTANVTTAQTVDLAAPTQVTAANSSAIGQAIVLWDAVGDAAFYRIGWVAFPDYQETVDDGRDWLEAFHFVDVVNAGQTEWTLTRLSPGVQYYFIVGSIGIRFGQATWSEWSNALTLTNAPLIDYSAQYPNCDAVRAHHPGGVKRGSPIYRSALDRDGDGLACEPAGDGSGGPALVSELADDAILSSSTSASATVELRLTIGNMPINAESGSSIELYLEDDFRVPNFIAQDTVHFTASNPFTADTNNGGPVVAAGAIEIHEGDHYGGNDDWAIRVFIPDMTAHVDGYQGLMRRQTVTLVFTAAAGIQNPSEEGIHSVGYAVLGADDDANGGPEFQLGTVSTRAKISLSDEDNTRGYELTVFGSGFNNGTSAAVYVLHDDDGTAPSCQEIIREGYRAGIATVGSDDKVAITFEVTVPTFRPGNNNYICMVDGEGRYSANVEQFELEPAIRVVPSSAKVGDTVTIFVQDYPNTGAGLTSLKIAGQEVFNQASCALNCLRVSANAIGADGSATVTFDLPGSIHGVPLEGTIRIDVAWGGVRADTKITVTGLTLGVALPNDTLTIQGEGFGGSEILPDNIAIDGVAMLVDSKSLEDGVVEVANAGQFSATVYVWPADSNCCNPTLISGTHTIRVEDDDGFIGTVTVVIKEPGMTVTSDVLGPGDYLAITGTDWPVDNPDSTADIGQSASRC